MDFGRMLDEVNARMTDTERSARDRRIAAQAAIEEQDVEVTGRLTGPAAGGLSGQPLAVRIRTRCDGECDPTIRFVVDGVAYEPYSLDDGFVGRLGTYDPDAWFVFRDGSSSGGDTMAVTVGDVIRVASDALDAVRSLFAPTTSQASAPRP